LCGEGYPGDDFKKTRHTALFFNSGNNLVGQDIHASGAPRAFTIVKMQDYKALSSDRLAGCATVAVIP
jgi:hypothetical protein